MNRQEEEVCEPSGPVTGPEYVWDEFNQLYLISDGKLIKQNDPYYDYYMHPMQQGFEYNPAEYFPVPVAAMPGIPLPMGTTEGLAIESEIARESERAAEAGKANDLEAAMNHRTSVTSGTVRNSERGVKTGTAQTPRAVKESGGTFSEPGTSGKTGTDQITASNKESETSRQSETANKAGSASNCDIPATKSGTIRDSEIASKKSELARMLINGKKLVRVESALEFLNSPPRMTLSKVSDVDCGNGTTFTKSLSELSRALKTSKRTAKLDKAIPKYPLHAVSTATVETIAKRLSMISKGDVKNAGPELFVLSRKGEETGKEGEEVKTGEGVGGNGSDQGQGYLLFRLHSSNDEDDESTTTAATTTSTPTKTSTTSDSTASSSCSSSDSNVNDSDDKKDSRRSKPRKTKKYFTTEDSSESDDDDDDDSDTDDDDDYDYSYYDYDDDYDYEDYSDSSSPRLLSERRKGSKVRLSSSETSNWNPVPNRTTRKGGRHPPGVQLTTEAPVLPSSVPATTQVALEGGSEYNRSNKNANNYLVNPVVHVSGQEASSAAEYIASEEEAATDQSGEAAFNSCVEDTALVPQEPEEWTYKEDKEWEDAPEDNDVQTYYDSRMTHNPVYDPQDDRRMTHNPAYDPQDDRRMTHNPAYEPQDDRRMTHNPAYDPQDERRMTHNPAYDHQDDRRMTHNPVHDHQDDRRMTHNLIDEHQEWQWQARSPETYEQYEMQRYQDANRRTDHLKAFGVDREEEAIRMVQEQSRLAEEESVRTAEEESMRTADLETRSANDSRSVEHIDRQRSTEFVEITAKAIAFPDGKYEIVDVDVVPLKPYRSGPGSGPGPTQRVKSSASRGGSGSRTKRTRRRAPSCKRIPLTSSNVTTQHLPIASHIPLVPPQIHPKLPKMPFLVSQPNGVTSQMNDVIVNKVNDVVPQRTTSATQTDFLTEVANGSIAAAAETPMVKALTKSHETATYMQTEVERRDSCTQTRTYAGDYHQQQQQHPVTCAASIPSRSPLHHRHPLNPPSAYLCPSPIPSTRVPSASSLAPQRSTCDQVQQTDRLEPDPSSSHLVKYGHFVYSLYQQDQLTDVVLKAGMECFYAHRSVLACHSRYFASVFTQDLVSSSSSSGPSSSGPTPDILEVNDISPVILKKIIEYIYTGRIALHHSFLLDILMAASKLELPQLETNCIRKLNALHPQELLDVMISAYKQGIMAESDLVDKLWHRIACHFKTVIRTKQFLQMNADCICRLLSDDDLVLTSEIDVAQAAIRWINDDREKRVPVAGKVLACVRFKNLTSDELVSFGRLESYILKDPAVKDAILEANWCHTCQVGRTDTGMTSVVSPREQQKTELRAQGYNAELHTHPWRN